MPTRDQSEIERLGLTPLSLEFIDNVLVPKLRGGGIRDYRTRNPCRLRMARIRIPHGQNGLKGNERRPITYLIARAMKLNKTSGFYPCHLWLKTLLVR